MAMNKVILCGRITKDIELKQTNGGISVTQFSIALNKGDGKADFFNVVSWRNTAEFISKYFSKGDGICIDGHLASRQYEKDGAKHTVYEVVADSVSFSDGRRASQSDANIEGEQMHTQSNKSSHSPSVKQESESYQHPHNIGLAPDVNLPHLEEIAPDEDLPF
jgi:single-strand DNA-binding protein